MPRIRRVKLKRPAEVVKSVSDGTSGFGVPIMVVQLLIIGLMGMGVYFLNRPKSTDSGNKDTKTDTLPPEDGTTNDPGDQDPDPDGDGDTTTIPEDPNNPPKDDKNDKNDKNTESNGILENFIDNIHFLAIGIVLVLVLVVSIIKYNKNKDNNQTVKPKDDVTDDPFFSRQTSETEKRESKGSMFGLLAPIAQGDLHSIENAEKKGESFFEKQSDEQEQGQRGCGIVFEKEAV